MYPTKSTEAVILFNPLWRYMKNINESKNPTPKNNSKFTLVVSIGVTKAMVDKTNKILKIFDPIIFPKDCLLYTSPSPRDRG